MTLTVGSILWICSILANGELTNCRKAEVKVRPYVQEIQQTVAVPETVEVGHARSTP